MYPSARLEVKFNPSLRSSRLQLGNWKHDGLRKSKGGEIRKQRMSVVDDCL